MQARLHSSVYMPTLLGSWQSWLQIRCKWRHFCNSLSKSKWFKWEIKAKQTASEVGKNMSDVGCVWASLSWKKPGTCWEATKTSSFPAHMEQELSPAARWWRCPLSDLPTRGRLSGLSCCNWCFPTRASQERCGFDFCFSFVCLVGGGSGFSHTSLGVKEFWNQNLSIPASESLYTKETWLE